MFKVGDHVLLDMNRRWPEVTHLEEYVLISYLPGIQGWRVASIANPRNIFPVYEIWMKPADDFTNWVRQERKKAGKDV